MSNDKLDATFHGSPVAVVHLVVLYEAVCHSCGWEADGNPFYSVDRANDAADEHRCSR